MLKRSSLGLLGTVITLPISFASPAQASGFVIVNGNMLALFQNVGTPNQCVSYAYDKNGNILVRTNQTYGSQGTWGTSTFGCFSWTGP